MPTRSRIRPLAPVSLPLQSIRIGRWAPNVSYPHHGYLDPVASFTPLVHEDVQQDLKQIYKEEIGAGTNLHGTILAHGSLAHSAHTQEHIATNVSKIYQLDNPEALFEDAIQREENRKWIETALKTYGAIYVIIGYQTVHNARIGEDVGDKEQSAVTFQAPATAAIAATTGIPLLGDGLDPSIGRESHNATKLQRSYNSPGERVIAVQYRRIRFQFFNSGKVGAKNLETKTRWRYVWNMRGHTSEANDTIEANLAYEDVEDGVDASDDTDEFSSDEAEQ